MKKLQTLALIFSLASPLLTNADSLEYSCEQLYAHLVATEKAHLYQNYTAYDDKFARFAGIATTSFTPAVIYIGYANYLEHLNEMDKTMLFHNMEALRYQLAQKNCFALK